MPLECAAEQPGSRDYYSGAVSLVLAIGAGSVPLRREKRPAMRSMGSEDDGRVLGANLGQRLQVAKLDAKRILDR